MPDFPSTEARYDSKCPGCGQSIVEGDAVFLVDGEWVDEGCAEVEEGMV